MGGIVYALAQGTGDRIHPPPHRQSGAPAHAPARQGRDIDWPRHQKQGPAWPSAEQQ